MHRILVMLILVLLGNPAFGGVVEVALDEYVDQICPWLTSVGDKEVFGSPETVSFGIHPAGELVMPSPNNDKLLECVGNSDFCYTIKIKSIRYLVANNSNGLHIGLGQTYSEIIKDHYYGRVGSFSPIWYHVDVPGKLEYTWRGQPLLERCLDSSILVFGIVNDLGVETILPGMAFLLRQDGGGVSDFEGREIDLDYLRSLIDRRRMESDFDTSLRKASIVAKAARAGKSMSPKYGPIEFDLVSSIKGELPNYFKVEIPRTDWGMVNFPNIQFGREYLLMLRVGLDGEYLLTSGKANVYEVDDGRYLGTSGYAVRDEF